MMDTPISSLMTSPVRVVSMDDTVEAAQALMAQHGLSWAPVVDADAGPVGVIALRDLLQFDRQRGDARDFRVWQVCHYPPLSVAADTDASEVARQMVEQHVHHVVVMKDHTMIGVVSALDLLRRQLVDADGPP